MAKHSVQSGVRTGQNGSTKLSQLRKHNDSIDIEIVTDNMTVDQETVTGAAIHHFDWDGIKEWFTYEDLKRLLQGNGRP